jgi:hypothetical protein
VHSIRALPQETLIGLSKHLETESSVGLEEGGILRCSFGCCFRLFKLADPTLTMSENIPI